MCITNQKPISWHGTPANPNVGPTNVGKGVALLGGIELRQQSGQVANALHPVGVLEGLVLREDVDKTLPHVVAVPAERVPATVAETVDDVVNPALRREGLRHAAQPGEERAEVAVAAAAVPP